VNKIVDTIACRLADYYAKLKYYDLPEIVIAKTRRVLVDFLATLTVGYHEGKLSSIINQYLSYIEGKPEATILCLNKKVPAINAALAMGVMAHSVELDDGHRAGTSHPGVAIIPAVLSIVERNQLSFKEILLAIAIGYDVMLRVARSINPSHLKRGFHSTGTCGAIGAAAACASLLGFDSSKMAYAISLGGLQSAGIQEMLHDNPFIKPIQSGKAAFAGVLAADLVKNGAMGPRTLFEGEHGWLKAMCDQYSLSDLIGELGERWEIMFTYTKLYPTCRHCHASLDLAIDAYQSLNCSIDNINSIEIKTYDFAIMEVGRIICPDSIDEAMFSLPFSIALALRDGKVILQSYSSKNLADENLRQLARKVVIQSDEQMNAVYPKERGAYLKVELKNGYCFEKRSSLPKGEPETALNDSELYNKIESIMLPYYNKLVIAKLWETCILDDVNSLKYTNIIEQLGREKS
jgi:2-methylcitrate dehydratase PrpD